jgi:hypothetical protein
MSHSISQVCLLLVALTLRISNALQRDEDEEPTPLTIETHENSARSLMERSGFDHKSGLVLVGGSNRSTKSRHAANAVVTHICSDSWAPGALALGASVLKFHPQHEVVVMVAPEVSHEYHNLLSAVFDRVYVMDPLTPHPSITRKGADCVTLQLRTWSLPYKKVLYMDADMLVLGRLDSLFETFDELSAKPDRPQYGWNGGFFMLEPNMTSYEKLSKALHTFPQRKSRDATLSGIQQFLNHMYPPCLNGSTLPADPKNSAGCWRHRFNSSQNTFTRDLTAASVRSLLAGDFSQTKSVHFSGDWGGDFKPWMKNCMKPSDSTTRNMDSKGQLRKDMIELWSREFRQISSFSIPPDSAHLLKLDCAEAQEAQHQSRLMRSA